MSAVHASGKSSGQALIEKLSAWYGGYLYLADPDVPLILALWSIGTWVFDQFYSFPYLAVTASVKGAGKSRVLELLNGTCRNALLTNGPSPAAILRLIAESNGHFTLLWDEAEVTSSDKKSFLSEVLNSGYRKGQVIPKAKGMEVVKWPSYCPKAFALIGDPTGTVRDRSIVLTMQRGNAAREYMPDVVEGEAMKLAEEIKHVLSTGSASVAAVPPTHLETRDREIWGAMFGLAEYLKLDKTIVAKLVRWSADNCGSKTAAARRNVSYESEDDALSVAYGERALRDLRSVFQGGEEQIYSYIAVERMKAIDSAPWRTFKGSGLTENTLSNLIKASGVRPSPVRMVKGKGASEVSQKRGYRLKDVRASVKD